MASLKILVVQKEKKDSKIILVPNMKFDQFVKFKDLRTTIFNYVNKRKVCKLEPKDNFILKYVKDERSNDYFPEELKGCFYDHPSFEYLKEKLSLREITDEYKFELVKVDKANKPFKRPEYSKILNQGLDEIWKPISDKLKQEVSLNKLEKSELEYKRLKEQLEENERKIDGTHEDILCNNCFKTPIQGKRFICAECNNYNLCQDCEKLLYKNQIHDRKHIFIQVNKPLLGNENNVLNYNNMISNNNQEIKNVQEDFEIPVDFINNGETNLKNCYVLPIRYGDEYLTCSPAVISESVVMNYNNSINLEIKIPQNNRKYYEGYFRMFTPNGLPFGQIFFIRVFKEKDE